MVVRVHAGIIPSHLDLGGRLATNLQFPKPGSEGNPLMFTDLVIITRGVRKPSLYTVTRMLPILSISAFLCLAPVALHRLSRTASPFRLQLPTVSLSNHVLRF